MDPERYNPDNCKPEDVEAIRAKYHIRPERNASFPRETHMGEGYQKSCAAMPMVLENYPNVKFVILGKYEQQNDIIETASRLGVSDRIACRFEFVPEKERILHYAASDVCIFSSTYESFGIVSLEAMSMAKPLVVGAQGAVGLQRTSCIRWT